MRTYLSVFGFVAGLVLAMASAQAAGKGAAAFDKAMKPIVSSYLKIQKALADDSTAGVQEAAKKIAALAGKLDGKGVTGEHAEHYKNLPAKLKSAAVTLSKAAALEDVREAFKQVSMPMAMWGTMSKPSGIDVVYCSMAKGSWLQAAGTVMNPYHGKSMLHCGEVVGGAAHAKKAGGHHGH